jgi:hypothetical protein
MAKQAHYLHFGCHLGDQDKCQVLHVLFILRYVNFNEWMKQKENNIFAAPMTGCETINHLEDCYFYLMKILGFSRSSKNKIEYPNIPPAMKSVPHRDLPTPAPSTNWKQLLFSMKRNRTAWNHS